MSIDLPSSRIFTPSGLQVMSRWRVAAPLAFAVERVVGGILDRDLHRCGMAAPFFRIYLSGSDTVPGY
jgi:hypothetical protein